MQAFLQAPPEVKAQRRARGSGVISGTGLPKSAPLPINLGSQLLPSKVLHPPIKIMIGTRPGANRRKICGTGPPGANGRPIKMMMKTTPGANGRRMEKLVSNPLRRQPLRLAATGKAGDQ